ncbi:hypothetical protein M23134_02805 [Microscilla marina ATCC 23134]|uniref:Uncharacterized protein n=2 Tax=Microscilla marina TaxID=1027 RepID=A1ZPQ3_MICM2|nr:hypothetical protein M23134_02805 [Microscilla marina ATCC 23134]
MLESLFSSETYNISFYKQSPAVLSVDWQEGSKWLNNQGFRESAERATAFVEQRQPKYLLINARKLNFIIVPELQEWYQKNIIPKYVKAGLEKIGVVLTGEFVADLAIKQVFSEKITLKNMQIKYFTSSDEVPEWFNVSLVKS